MMHKLGLKLWSSNVGVYLSEADRLYSEGVFDYIELFVVPETTGTIGSWLRLHDEKGIPFVVHNAHFAVGFNIADASVAERNREIYVQTKAFADALGARYVIFHGGVDGTIEETVRQLKSFCEPRALLENKPFVPLPNKVGARFCRAATIEEISHVLRETECGFCLDVGHAVCAANSQGLEPYAYVNELATRFSPAMFHIADLGDISSVHDAHLHLGTGALDISQICRDVFTKDAEISIETVKDNPDNLSDFRHDADMLRSILTANEGEEHV